MSSSADIVVYGATGLVGGRVCAELDRAGASFTIAGRRRGALDALAPLVAARDVRVAELDAPDDLAHAFEGARVVVNCAGPLADTGAPVLAAALAAGADYVDTGGDQAALHELYERFESAARRAGRVAAPGCGVDCALGDWASAWAAAYACGVADDSAEPVRDAPAPRIAEDRPLDEVAVTYIYDDLVLSPAAQRSLFATMHARRLAWRRDRWETVPSGRPRRVNAGAAFGGERDAVAFPGGDAITVPQHVAARAVDTYLSLTRRPAATVALRLLARAMPHVPKRATEFLAPYAPNPEDYARTHFAVVSQVRRGFSAAQVAVSGADPHRASAAIAAWVARSLAARVAGPVGVRAPAELFRPAAALHAVADAADLALEPSFR